tara:strand:+ start:49 stop:630 length:582 start_codon:yes stop_codon:yes gene_type:complete
MKFPITFLLTSFLFSQDLVDNIYSDSFQSLNKNIDEISTIKTKLGKKYNQLIDDENYDMANIAIKMKHELQNNWGQLFGLLEVLSITNDILLYSAYHDCDVSLKHPNKPKFHTISNAKNKPNPNSKALLNLAIRKLNIMSEAVGDLIKIDLKYFNRIANSNDEEVQDNISQFAVEINNILNDIKENINKMVIT